MKFNEADSILERIRRRQTTELTFRNSSGSPAYAVMVPLIREADGSLSLLYEVRSGRLSAQPGEISFPGGRIEEGEEPYEAALRETMEELLIKPEQIHILAGLDGMGAPAGGAIWPFVGELTGYENTFSTDEVSEVFRIPLKFFMEHTPERYGTTLLMIPDDDFPYERLIGGKDYQFAKRRHELLFYEYQKRSIWGVTARVTWRFCNFIK